MKKYILLIVSAAAVYSSKAQGFELTGNFLTPGYTLAAYQTDRFAGYHNCADIHENIHETTF